MRGRSRLAGDDSGDFHPFLTANSSWVVWAPPRDARSPEGVSRGYFCFLFWVGKALNPSTPGSYVLIHRCRSRETLLPLIIYIHCVFRSKYFRPRAPLQIEYTAPCGWDASGAGPVLLCTFSSNLHHSFSIWTELFLSYVRKAEVQRGGITFSSLHN